MEYDFSQACAILERTPATLSTLLSGLDDVWIHANEGGDSFSPFDVLGHLIEADQSNWLVRAEVILITGGAFPPFDRFAHQQRNAGRTLNQLLDEFARVRQHNLQTIKSWNITQNLERTGQHPTFGQVTLRQLLSTWVVHDLGHLAQMARVMAKQYTPEVGHWIEFLPILTDRETTPTITIRHAVAADLDKMLAWRGHSDAAKAAIGFEFARLSSAENTIFLAHHGAKLVGTVQLVRHHPDPDLACDDSVYVQAVEVRCELRRNGLAKRLCLALEEQARLEQKKRTTVAIEPDNAPSLGLFASLGYVEFKRSSYVWDGVELPIVCLEKWL
jgi:ribosomal protein S18 acetylase RimI-like enzyme